MDSTEGSCLYLMIVMPFAPMKISSQVGMDNVTTEGWKAIAIVSTEVCKTGAAKLVCVFLPHTRSDLLSDITFINSMALSHKTEMREVGVIVYRVS